eukprot:scaffold160737_cov35-Prasinocladus_malaysianus.AAC.2
MNKGVALANSLFMFIYLAHQSRPICAMLLMCFPAAPAYIQCSVAICLFKLCLDKIDCTKQTSSIIQE